MRQKIFLPFTIIVALSFSICLAQTAKPIGTVAMLQGKVWREVGEKKIPLSLSADIFEGDLIRTENKSYIKLLLTDDSIFDLGPDTQFKFEKFELNQDPSERTGTFNFLYGKMRSLFTVKAKEGHLKIKTPNVAMGVRGTEILANVQTIQKQTTTEIALLSGKISLQSNTSKLGSPQTLTLEKGMLFNSQKLLSAQNFSQSLSTISTQQMMKLANPNPASMRPTFLNEMTQKRSENKGTEGARPPQPPGGPNGTAPRPSAEGALPSTMPERLNKEISPNQERMIKLAPAVGPGPGGPLPPGKDRPPIQQMQNQRSQAPGMGMTNQRMQRPRCQFRQECKMVPNFQSGTVVGQHQECRQIQFPPGCQN